MWRTLHHRLQLLIPAYNLPHTLQCWEITPVPSWAEIIPWTVNSLPMLHQRVRFIKTLLWAMPERAQHLGIILALGVDEVQWIRITNELPEIVPRGAHGWERYY